MATKVRVLVIEGHTASREILALMLELEGYDVQTAQTGLDALTALEEARPSVILLDPVMSPMDGEEFRRRQLADPRFQDIPLICVTAQHDGYDQSMKMGAIAYCEKPVDFEQLVAAVRTHAVAL